VSPRPDPARQPFMPEGAGNPARVRPHHTETRPSPARLYDGHLSAECSIRGGGAPACPACLSAELRERLES